MGNILGKEAAVKKIALKYCSRAAIAKAQPLQKDLNALQGLINKGYPPGLHYLNRDPAFRADITKWFPDARSVLVCSFQYWDNSLPDALLKMSAEKYARLHNKRYSGQKVPPLPVGIEGMDNLEVSRYAVSTEYHGVVKGLLEKMLAEINAEVSPIEGKIFAGASPVLEKALAAKAGLGWIGKHTIFIGEETGSYVFLGGIAFSRGLIPDEPKKFEGCGNCQACIDACPTGALKPYELNTNLCLAYWANRPDRNEVPKELLHPLGNKIKGCDICQQVCPKNKSVKSKTLPALMPLEMG
ncbi:MAG: DUF1730 domain-containing protein [Elusimicrobia bacterium]|nr:DUF1730 domain-containing protein [Elusimicrobiota bacterium]